MREVNFVSKWKTILTALIVATLGFAAFYTLYNLGNSQGYAPEQPIPFSHQRHVAQNKIPCQYCHSQVDRSRHAGIPSMNVCMNCHSVVATDKPNIQKLRKLFEEGKSFEWVKVHDMPDFVYFNHARHIAKKVECKTCHGNVDQMARVEQVMPMTMGWCVDCHRTQKEPAPIQCTTCHR